MSEKVYIGDGAYVEFDRWGSIVLTTSNGLRDTNRVVLEPSVWDALIMAIEKETKRRAETEEP